MGTLISAEHDLLSAGRFLTSAEVMYLLQIKSPTTLIKMEREGFIKVVTRIGNQKRYSPKFIKRLMGF